MITILNKIATEIHDGNKWLIPFDLLYEKSKDPEAWPPMIHTELAKQITEADYDIDPGYGDGYVDLCLIQANKDLS